MKIFGRKQFEFRNFVDINYQKRILKKKQIIVKEPLKKNHHVCLISRQIFKLPKKNKALIYHSISTINGVLIFCSKNKSVVILK